MIAALACPPDPPGIAWVRLFVNGDTPVQKSWQALWEAVEADLSAIAPITVGAIVLQDWFATLLIENNFHHHQDIVMLQCDPGIQDSYALPANISIRPMLPGDLPCVARVDTMAFEPLWQNSLFALNRALPLAAVATVAELEGEIIAYQISTRNSLGMHLARLAVEPARKGQGIGSALVRDLCSQVEEQGISRLTVNTQSDNSVSLALYKKVGFQTTGESYPVFLHKYPG